MLRRNMIVAVYRQLAVATEPTRTPIWHGAYDGALAVVHHPPYFGYIHIHSCKHKTVTLKLTLTLTLTLTDTGGAVLTRAVAVGVYNRNTAGGELQQERRLRP